MKEIAVTNVTRFLSDSAVRVENVLDRIVPDENTEPARLHKAVRHSLFAGGKRFRPALLFAVGETFGADWSQMETTASAVEMIHTYSLIHDDLPAMDDDALRRGKPTCHIEFGEATAILAGDVLQTLAFKSIAEDGSLEAETRTRLIAEVGRAAGTPQGMVAGQQMDLEAEGRHEGLSLEQLKIIHLSKTGALIRASARCGAIIAGAEDEDVDAVSRYAENLGLLFQVTDDLLDITGSSAALGKTAGKDQSSAKSTYPSVFGVDRSKEIASELFGAACSELEKLQNPAELLTDMAEFIRDRQS